MAIKLKPSKGGFLRPFGCGEFIRDYLLGKMPYRAPAIDPSIGAPQADICREYKLALIRERGMDRAVQLEEKLAKMQGRAISPDEIDELFDRYFAQIPYKTTACRYHSFVVYFSMLIRLHWVVCTGMESPSDFQKHFPDGPSRKYYRITEAGRNTPDSAWRNPQKYERERLKPRSGT
ncbi:MAG: hypothetical protein AAC993_03730 [Dehalococcoides mccartyi]|uniref:hypothetical protein n=2 Tax=Dehalococcoides mccartyi TaxID=61435 RepID=UPI0030FC7E9C